MAADIAIGCGTSMGLFSMPPISLLAEWATFNFNPLQGACLGIGDRDGGLELLRSVPRTVYFWLLLARTLAKSYRHRVDRKIPDLHLHSGVAQIPPLFLFSRNQLAAQIARMRAGWNPRDTIPTKKKKTKKKKISRDQSERKRKGEKDILQIRSNRGGLRYTQNWWFK